MMSASPVIVQPVRVAIVGTVAVARLHAEALAGTDGVRIVAAAGPSARAGR